MANIVIKRSFNANAPITVEALSGFLFTQENQAHVFEIDGISSGSATGYFIAPDGTTKTCPGTVSGGKASVTLSQDCYNDPGRFKFAILNSTGGVSTCIYAAVGNVYRTKDGEIYDSGEVVPDLQQLLGYIADCQQAADRADDAADVILGGEVTITQSSSNIMNGYWNGIVGQTMSPTEQEDTTDQSTGTVSGYRTVRNPIDISEFIPGTTISLKSTVTGNHGVRIADKNMKVLAYYSGNNGNAPIDVTMTVPEGAKYLTQVIRYYSTHPERTAISNFSVTGTTGGIIPRIEAIEEQIGSADGSADSNVVLAENLTSSSVNAGMLRNDNTITAHASYSYTNYIYVEPYDKLFIKNLHITGSAGLVFVDGDISNPMLVQGYKSSDFSGYTTGSDVTIDVPEGACYFRTSQLTAQISNLKIIASMSTTEAITKLYKKEALENPLDKILHDGGLCKMFRRMGVVGDSLSSGSMTIGNEGLDEDEQTISDTYWYSWIQYMGRYCGNEAINFSKGGASTRTLRAPNRSSAAVVTDIWERLTGRDATDPTVTNGKEQKCELYFIALGHNDYNENRRNPGSLPISAANDIDFTNEENNADTYRGNYAFIIQTIKRIQPKAIIVCITMKNETVYGEYNAVIRQMPGLFNPSGEEPSIFLMDMATYYPYLNEEWELTNGHGNAMGYLNYSWQVSTYMDWIIRKNYKSFKKVQFIPVNNFG